MQSKKFLYLCIAVLLTAATATFGQTAPKMDRQAFLNSANNKQRSAEATHALPAKHEQHREKPRQLFLPRNAETARQSFDQREKRNLSPLRAPKLSAAQESKLLLDSTVTRPNPVLFEEGTDEKTTYGYNAAGQVILEIDYERNNQTGAWDEYQRRGYDDYGRLIFETKLAYSSYWSEKTQEYINEEVHEKREYAYDTHGNEILYIRSRWDNETNQWVSEEKHECAYDHLNWQTLSATYHWNDTASVPHWVGYSNKYVYEYADHAGRYDEVKTEYTWNNNAWQIYNKTEITYSGQRQYISNREEMAVEQSLFYTPAPYRERNYSSDHVLTRADYYWDYDYYQQYGTWYSASKIEYLAEDSHGNITEWRNHYWNRDYVTNVGSWEVTAYRRNFTYNADGWIIACAEEYYNASTNNTWQPNNYGSFGIVYTRDGTGNITGYVGTLANGDGYGKADYTYDAQNRIVRVTEYNKYADGYKAYSKSEYAYDSNGKVVSVTLFYRQDDAWQKELKYERALDAYGNEILRTEYRYNEDGVVYSYQKSERAYDAAGRETMFSSASTDYENGEIVQTYGYKSEYVHDDNGNQTLIINYKYDAATQTFIPERKSEYTYGNILVNLDGDNEEKSHNPLTIKQYTWKNGAWVAGIEGKYEWQFDADDNPLTMSMSLKSGSEWIWYGSMTWYYSQHEVSGTITVPNDELRIYPNPVRTKLFIMSGQPTENLTIYNLSGIQMVNCNWSDGQSIDVSHWPAGIYIIKTDNHSCKFVKE